MLVDPVVVLDPKVSVLPVVIAAPLSPFSVPNWAEPLVSMAIKPVASILLSAPVRLAAKIVIRSAESMLPSARLPSAEIRILAPVGALLFWLPPRPVVVSRVMAISPSASMLLVPPLVNVPMLVLPTLAETKASAIMPRSTRILPPTLMNADPSVTVSESRVASPLAKKRASPPLVAVVMAMPP